MSRPFCKELSKEAYKSPWYDSKFNVKPTKISRWKSFLLLFYKRRVDGDDHYGIVYKQMRGKVYIINSFKKPFMGYNCRHTLTPKQKQLTKNK